jgi:CBS domain containing-hemolysin-like protein
MTLSLIVAVAVLLAIQTLVSYASRLYTEMGKFLSREFQENIEAFETLVEPHLGVSRDKARLSFAILEQLMTSAIAIIVAYGVFRDPNWKAAELAEAVLFLALVIVVFNRLLPFVFFSRTRGTWLAKFNIPLRVLIYLSMPVTLVLAFCTSVAALAHEQVEPVPETSSEAVDALIEAGQEEGILEESDRRLIQSVVEFGDKTVREAMTPRPEIFAVPGDTTIEKLTEMLKVRRFSRVPVYEGTIDKIVGIVVAHDILQITDTEASTRTVRTLAKQDLLFVPESKSVSDLLREMQKDNIRMAIVVDEYGAVAGLVTTEDMVEEIVGELRDEHEAKVDVVREGAEAYVVPGSVGVDRLYDLFGVSVEGREATTVGGLVSEIAGRIPQAKETVEAEGLKFEVLASTDRRIERLRIRRATAVEKPHPGPSSELSRRAK